MHAILVPRCWELLVVLLLAAAVALPTTAALAVGPRKSAAPRRSPPGGSSPRRSSGNGNTNVGQGGSSSDQRSRAGYSLRREGVKTNSGRVKPPRWEREGDDLYAQFTTTTTTMVGMVEAREMLAQLAPNTTNVTESAPKGTKRITETLDMEINAPVTASPTTLEEVNPWYGLTVVMLKDELRSRSLPVSGTKPELVARLIENSKDIEQGVKEDDQIESQINETISQKKKPPPGTLWGTLSVGPVLRSRLVDQAGLTSPTPVQEAAFHVILKGENAVICSPTGTGKSLAYLVPLLAKLGAGAPTASAIIVTPTVELALQLQREVHDRLAYSPTLSSEAVLHVVGDSSSNTNSDSTDNEMLLNSIGNAPFLAGTPKTLLHLLAEAKRSTNNKVLAQTAKAVLFNPKCIVLDEADRLLQTEQIARDAAAAKQPVSWKKKMIAKKTNATTTTTQTEFLLRALLLLARSSSRNHNLQLVCASATVGRTLRTQLQHLIGAPSIDKAAVLVTADDRTKKNAESWVVPTGIAHAYRLISSTTEEEEHKKTKKDKNTAATATSKKEVDDDVVHEATLNALWDTMQQLKPATALVFPGRAGVDRVREGLVSRGLRDVRTLRDLDNGGNNNNKIDEDSDDDPLVVAGWESTTVFVVGEKFARGLDLQPGVDYVFLMSPPSSAAGYAHMAGRTGRNGRPGKVVMLVRPKEATKVVAIAGALGLSFLPVEEVIESAAPVVTSKKEKTVKRPSAIAAAGEVVGTDVAVAAPKKKKSDRSIAV